MSRTVRRPRVLMVTENLPLAHDHRAKKQVRSLLDAGIDVAFVGREHADNDVFRDTAGLELYGYGAPREPTRKLGYLWEYGYSLVASAIAICAREGSWPVRRHPDGRSAGRLVLARAAAAVDGNAVRGRPARSVTGAVRDAIRDRGRDGAAGTACARTPVLAHGRPNLRDQRTAPRHDARARWGPTGARRDRRERTDARLGGQARAGSVVAQRPRPPGVLDRDDGGARQRRHRAQGRPPSEIRVVGRTDCQFVFIGDGEVLPELRRLTKELDIEPWVTFTGWLPQERAFAYLSTADVGLEPIVQEDIATVKCLEYMAFGLPFVGSDLPEIRGPAEDAAAYVPPEDVDAFARAIDGLLADRERRREMGAIARRRVEAVRPAWERQEERFLEVYRSLLPGDAVALHEAGR